MTKIGVDSVENESADVLSADSCITDSHISACTVSKSCLEACGWLLVLPKRASDSMSSNFGESLRLEQVLGRLQRLAGISANSPRTPAGRSRHSQNSSSLSCQTLRDREQIESCLCLCSSLPFSAPPILWISLFGDLRILRYTHRMKNKDPFCLSRLR